MPGKDEPGSKTLNKDTVPDGLVHVPAKNDGLYEKPQRSSQASNHEYTYLEIKD